MSTADQRGPFAIARDAWAKPANREGADLAFASFIEWSPNLRGQSRVPGLATHARLAIHLDRGRTSEEAAGREYLYRWNLFLGAMLNHLESKSRARDFSIWPAPHVWGM